jgi:hypothetical protein
VLALAHHHKIRGDCAFRLALALTLENLLILKPPPPNSPLKMLGNEASPEKDKKNTQNKKIKKKLR